MVPAGCLKPLRRSVLLALALASASPALRAQVWPSKPVRIVVPFPPGGIVDTVARQLQPRLQAALGQPVLIDNKGGAGGTVGVGEVARAAPDGHTLVMVFDSFATYPLVYPKLGYDIAKDLAPVTQIASNPLVLVVHPAVPAQDLKSFVALARSRPGRLNYAPVATPRPVIDRLQVEIRKILEAPDFAARLTEQGLSGIGGTPEQFAAALRAEQAKWTRLVTERRLSLE